MRNAAKKWQTRARKYLTLLATSPEAAKKYRLHFWKGDKFDKAVDAAKDLPLPNARSKSIVARVGKTATLRRVGSAGRLGRA